MSPTGTVTFYERHERAGNGAARQRHGNFRHRALAVGHRHRSPRFTAAIPTSPTARRRLLSQTVNADCPRPPRRPPRSSPRRIVSPARQSVDRSSPRSPPRHHGKAAKKVVTSKKAVPHGGSSTKFHQTKQTADLKRSVAMRHQACERESQKEVIARVGAEHETTTVVSCLGPDARPRGAAGNTARRDSRETWLDVRAMNLYSEGRLMPGLNGNGLQPR